MAYTSLSDARANLGLQPTQTSNSGYVSLNQARTQLFTANAAKPIVTSQSKPTSIKTVQAPKGGFNIGDTIKNIESGVSNVVNTVKNIAVQYFPETIKEAQPLGINPVLLKSDPLQALNDYVNTVKDSWNNAITSTENIFKPNATISQRVGAGLKAVPETVGAVAAPLTSLLSVAEKSPSQLGSYTRLINVAFSALGEGGKDIASKVLDIVPTSVIPQKVKNDIKPGVEEIFSLAAQILAGGKVAKGEIDPVKTGELIDKYGVQDAMTIETKAKELAKQTKPLTEGTHTPQEITDHVIQSGIQDTPQGKQLLKAVVDAQKQGSNIDIKSPSPLLQSFSFFRDIKTSEDPIINPELDQISGIMKEYEDNQSQQEAQSSSLSQINTNQVESTSGQTSQITEESQNQSTRTGQNNENINSTRGQGSNNRRESITTSNRGGKPTEPTSSSTNPIRNGKAISKLTTDIQNRLQTNFKDIPGYEKMDMKEQAIKSVDSILKTPYEKQLDLLIKPPKGIEAGSIFTALREKAFAEGDIQRLHELAKSSVGTTAGQALKAFDTFNGDDPVAAIKEVIDARTKAIESKGKSLEQIQKETMDQIQQEVSKAVKRGSSGTKAKLADFIKEIQCK